MPYVRITGTHNGRAAIAYALGNGKGHNGHAIRNEYISAVNMAPPSAVNYADQMQRYWNRASIRNKNQVRRIVISYSREELDPDNPADILKADMIAREFAEKAYPGRMVLCCTQTDGKSHLVHSHLIICNVDLEHWRGCTDEQTKQYYARSWVEKIAAQYVTPDQGQHTQDKVTRTERVKREAGAYVWKDDLRERIAAAQAEASSLDDFLERLASHGVAGTMRSSKKRGPYILYELRDTSGFAGGKVPANLKSKSYKLGAGYGIEKIKAMEKIQPGQMTTANATITPAAGEAKPYPDIATWAKSQGYIYDPTNFDAIFDAYQDARRQARTGRQDAARPTATPAKNRRQQEAGKQKQDLEIRHAKRMAALEQALGGTLENIAYNEWRQRQREIDGPSL